MKVRVVIYIILSFSSICLYSQDLSKDIVELQKLNQDTVTKRSFLSAKNNTNELQILLSGAFLIYKTTVSSQDGSKCAFHISCSEYALVAIKKQGLIVGSLNFFDRFTRCNTCSPYQYSINPVTHRFDDPVL